MKAITLILLTTIVLTGCKKEKDTTSSDGKKKVQSITLTGYEDKSIFTYDNQGRITQIEENWGTVFYSYENNKVLISARRNNEDTERYTGEISLDGKGRFSKAVYEYIESGSIIDYTFQYNAEGYCNKVTRAVKDGNIEVYDYKIVKGNLVQTNEFRNGAPYRAVKYTYYEDKPYKLNQDNRYGNNTVTNGMTGLFSTNLVKSYFVEDAGGNVIHKADFSYQSDKAGYVIKEIISYPMQNEELHWNYGYK
jgi:hypothetical protein